MLAIPNLISFILLLGAVHFARKRNFKAHKTMVFLTMLTSFVLVYLFIEMRLQGGSLISKDRMAVFSLGFKLFLASHIIAASITFVLSLIVCSLGLREVRKKWHKKIAYFMIPIWAYSAISGVTVFAMVGSPDDPIEAESSVFTRFEKQIALDGLRFNSPAVKHFDEHQFIGKWTLLFFGYTHCPDICPMTLSNVSQLLKRNSETQGVFITADPKRDTEKVLQDYIANFHSTIIPLRSTEAQENDLSLKLGSKIVLEEADANNPEQYSVFHPTGLYLVSPAAMVVGFYNYPLDIDLVSAHLRKIQSQFIQNIVIENVRIMQPLKGSDMTAGYLRILNSSGKAEEIIAASSPDFEDVQIHQSKIQDGGMKMILIEKLEIQPHSSFDLSPGGYHLMLFRPKRLFKPGDLLKFSFKRTGGDDLNFVGTVMAR